MKRAILAGPLLALLIATSAPQFRGGLWEQRNDPGTATLDGKPLPDLPLDPVKTQTICLSPDQAAAPAQWIARDLSTDCTLSTARLAAGRVSIAGTCPPQDGGGVPGTLKIDGHWTPTSFDVTFATTSKADIGTMGFTGHMVARRVGDCPAG